jgi:hypothetical protein
VHHRDFPEIWSEAGSAAEAARLLIGKLSNASETTPSDWQRDTILQAMQDVSELLIELSASGDEICASAHADAESPPAQAHRTMKRSTAKRSIKKESRRSS